MTYIVINQSNLFDGSMNTEYATEADADQAASNALQKSPTSIMVTAKLLKKFKAEVVVTSEDATTTVPEVTPEE